VLERGGNAVDAAVATAFALTVVEPGMSGLGGRTVLLVGRPGGRVEGLDGATAWPEKWVALRKAGAQIDPPRGWGQVAVPGTLAALAEAARRWGTRPLRELMRPAIYLARDGFLVSDGQERLFAQYDWRMADPSLRAVFLRPDGTHYRAGERLRQPDLARTLERIAREGADLFYRGEIARALAAEMERRAGYVTREDLAAFRSRPALIDRVSYGPYRVIAMDRPAMGRALLWRLRVLDRLPRYSDRVDDRHALAELLAVEPPAGPADETDEAQRERLLSGESVDATAKAIADRIAARASGLPASMGEAVVTHTTHLVAADRSGRVVSLTQSLGPFFGADVLLPGYGITFAATMGYLRDQDVSQGPISSIAPVLVLDAEGDPVLGIGAAGAARIPGVILQVLHNALDRQMGIEEAVAAPRISLDREAGRLLLRMDARDQPSMQPLAAGLESRGILCHPVPAGQVLARVHALMRGKDGGWTGAADPRGFGSAVTPLILERRSDTERSGVRVFMRSGVPAG
jgi:gamma-glutamyltranspeptidase/glutathione hydrolase